MFIKVNVAVPVFEQKIYNAPPGALFTINEGGIEMAGTDGHRMAYISKEGVKLPIQANGVLPKKLLDELPKILTDFDKNKERDSENGEKKDAVKIGLSGNHSIFSLSNIQIYARFLEKKFPDYKGAITANNEKLVIIDRDRFRQAIRRVSLITEKRDWFVLFKFFPGKLILDSESAEAGDAHDEIDVEYQGDPLEIGFNPKYILDFLSVIESPEVALEMNDNESMAILRPSDKKNVKFIIMPVRL
jgi:DNA polymerase-3 subunit beta